MSLCHSSCNELLLFLMCNSYNAWVLMYKCLRQSSQHNLFSRNILKAEGRLLVEKGIKTFFYTQTFCVCIWIFFVKYYLSSSCLCLVHSLLMCLFTVSAQTEAQNIPSECKKNLFQYEDDSTLEQVAQCSCGVSTLGGEWRWAACCSLPWTSQKCLLTSVVLCSSVLTLLAVLQ